MDDAAVMAPRLRSVDVEEIKASSGANPLESLSRAVIISDHCRTGLANGEIVLMFGTVRHCLLGDNASIWMLATDALAQHSTKFLRECTNEIVSISKDYGIIENWCDARNGVTLRWLKWLGFTIEPQKPYGIYQMPFHHFYKEVNQNV